MQNVESDSITSGLLEHPLYTRPRTFQGLSVPAVLINGDHKKIQEWRREQSLKRTFYSRPDLIESVDLDSFDTQIIKDLPPE